MKTNSKQYIDRISLSTALTILVFSILSYCLCFAQGNETMNSRIVAIVGDEIILSSEVELAVAMSPVTVEITDEESYNKFARNQLDELINEKLILIAAKDDSIEVTSEEVESIWEDRWEQIQSSFATAEQLEAALSNEGYTLNEFKRKMKKQINDFLIKQRFIERHFGFVEVSKSEVEKFYSEYKDSLPMSESKLRLSVIVISLEEDTTLPSNVQSLIDTIYKKLEAGVTFEDLAVNYSTDSLSAQYGGEVGNFEPGELPPIMDSVAFSLQVGEISEPVKTKLGIHILKVNEKNDNQISLSHILLRMPVSDDRNTKLEQLTQQAYRDAISDSFTFEELVNKYSTDTTYTKNNGDLGWFRLEEISPELKEVILSHEIGDVLPPIQELGEYHIFKVTDFKQSEPITLEDDYDAIKNFAKQHKQMTKLRNFLEEFKKDVYIEVRWEE
ncbi:peptidylprolyl isomerase [bacterium]|nr:peptidylprolyl isomerase [bacterium]